MTILIFKKCKSKRDKQRTHHLKTETTLINRPLCSEAGIINLTCFSCSSCKGHAVIQTV